MRKHKFIDKQCRLFEKVIVSILEDYPDEMAETKYRDAMKESGFLNNLYKGVDNDKS